jgi:short-subunit dehydrogenase
LPVITVVGAGPGLGLSIAKVFGSHGFKVALISRSQGRLDVLAERLALEGVETATFSADVRDRPSLVDALSRVKDRYGAIDVLEYSPAASGSTIVSATEVTAENVQPFIDYQVYGAMTAVEQVLPDMLQRGDGTLLFTTGASSMLQIPRMGNYSVAGAALRHWVLTLHEALADKGVYVAHVPIAGLIGKSGPEMEPDTVADIYWELYTKRDEVEHPYGTLPDSFSSGER